MKQTSFIVKNLRGNFPEKQFTIVKRHFRYSTKPLSLDSIIPIDELITEIFYRFKTSESSIYECHPFCTESSM